MAHTHPLAARRPVGTAHPLEALARVHDAWRQRRALERLDAAALRDLGLTPDDVRAELRRPLWGLPRL